LARKFWGASNYCPSVQNTGTKVAGSGFYERGVAKGCNIFTCGSKSINTTLCVSFFPSQICSQVSSQICSQVSTKPLLSQTGTSKLYIRVHLFSLVHTPGVNQRSKVHLYSGPTSIVIIFLPGQPYHIIDFSFIFKHECSEYLHLFIKNHEFGL
jgi:hypothetical protein